MHLHGLFLDGVFRRGPGDVLVFRRATPPTREELTEVLCDVRERCLRWLRREGLVDPEDAGAIGHSSECGALEGLVQAAMQRGTVESLPLPSVARPDDADDPAFGPLPGGRWSVSADGWNLHAGVCIPAGDFDGRERLVRYVARPSLALGRLSELPDRRLAYRVRWARSASGPYRILEPVELMARLAAIVPPPRYPLLTYHGILAPASRWRPNVVPRARDAPSGCAHDDDSGSSGKGAPGTLSPGASCACHSEPEPAAEPVPRPAVPRAAVRAVGLLARSAEPDESEYDPVIPLERWKQLADGALLARAPRIDWPRLLRRTFAQDVLVCPRCVGRLQVLDVVAKPDEARKELAELGFDVAGSGAIERIVSGPTGPRSPGATDAVPGIARRRNPGGTRSPPARAGPDAPGACIRSSQYPTAPGCPPNGVTVKSWIPFVLRESVLRRPARRRRFDVMFPPSAAAVSASRAPSARLDGRGFDGPPRLDELIPSMLKTRTVALWLLACCLGGCERKSSSPASGPPSGPAEAGPARSAEAPEEPVGPTMEFDAAASTEKLQGTWVMWNRGTAGPMVWSMAGESATVMTSEGRREESRFRAIAPCRLELKQGDERAESMEWEDFAFAGDRLYSTYDVGIRQGEKTWACLAAGVFVHDGRSCSLWRRHDVFAAGPARWQVVPAKCGYEEDGKVFVADDTGTGGSSTYGESRLSVLGDLLLRTDPENAAAERVGSFEAGLARRQEMLEERRRAEEAPQLPFAPSAPVPAPSLKEGDHVFAAMMSRGGEWSVFYKRIARIKDNVVELGDGPDWAPLAFVHPLPDMRGVREGAPVLRAGQPPSYASFVRLEEDKVVLACSPSDFCGPPFKDDPVFLLEASGSWSFGAPAAYRDGDCWRGATVLHADGDQIYVLAGRSVLVLPRADVELIDFGRTYAVGDSVRAFPWVPDENGRLGPGCLTPARVVEVGPSQAWIRVEFEDGRSPNLSFSGVTSAAP